MCWLSWGIWIICGFPPPCSRGPPTADILRTGSFSWERIASLWDILLLPASFLPSVHSAALEMELLPLWLCLGFHFLTVEWRNQSGNVMATSQGGCELVSFPGHSKLSVTPVLTRLGPFGKLMDCQSRREGNEWVLITLYLLTTMPCASCSLIKGKDDAWERPCPTFLIPAKDRWSQRQAKVSHLEQEHLVKNLDDGAPLMVSESLGGGEY